MANPRVSTSEGHEELLNILQDYFRNAAIYHPQPDDAGNTTYFSLVGADFVFESAFALHQLQPTSPLFSQHENLLQSLATSLQDIHDDLAAHSPPDYLFFASLIYVGWLLSCYPVPEVIKTDIGRNLILVILQYHARFTRLRTDIKEDFYDTLGDFEQDWPDFVKLAEELGVVLPPPGVQPPTYPTPLEGAEIQEEPRQLSGDAIVDVRVDPLGEWSLEDNASAHSSLNMVDDKVTA